MKDTIRNFYSLGDHMTSAQHLHLLAAKMKRDDREWRLEREQMIKEEERRKKKMIEAWVAAIAIVGGSLVLFAILLWVK